MRLPRFAAICAALLAGVSPARAQSSGDVLFNGFILGTCTVIVLTPGILALDGDGDQLSSLNPGGLPATANVITTSIGYRVGVDEPANFMLAPSGGDTSVDYSARYSGSGASIILDLLAGILSLLGIGTTLIEVNATVDKLDGAFPAGEYLLPVTVRCVSL